MLLQPQASVGWALGTFRAQRWQRAWSWRRRRGPGDRQGAGAGAAVRSGGERSRDILRGRRSQDLGKLPREPARPCPGTAGTGGGRRAPAGRAEVAPWRCTAALPRVPLSGPESEMKFTEGPRRIRALASLLRETGVMGL